jgi:tRNA(Ile2) C34 agmatinyltransferase TiaS
MKGLGGILKVGVAHLVITERICGMISKLKKWRCPKCGQEIEALGQSVGHACPKNSNKFTEWVKADGK